jgi:Na+-driven multidrug efflux pump
VAFSIPLLGVGMCCSGLLRATGDAKRAMFVTLSAGITAAIFDPIFIIYLDLGIRGAAITTFITRIVLTLIGLYGIVYVHKMIAIPSRSQLLKLIKPFLVIAIPAVLTQIATPFSNAYMTAMMSEFGDGAVAGWAIIGRLVPLAFVAIFTLSAAVGPILGQNLGAKRYDRINSTMWDSLKFALIYTLFTWSLLAIFADQIIFIFDATDEAASLVKFFSLVIGGTYLFQAGLFVANAAFNNLGYPLLATFFNWGRATLGTIPFAWVGSYWGPNGALAGFGIGGILFGVTAILVCFRVIRRLPEKNQIDQKL